MLRLDPSKRISALEVLKDPWLSEFSYEKKIELNQDFVNESFKNILNFNCSKKFQQACTLFMIHNVLDAEELKDVRKLFEYLDTNKDGKLTYDEITIGFKDCFKSLKMEKNFIKHLIKLNEDDKDYFEYDKFFLFAVNKRNLVTEDKLRLTFDLFDKDKSDSISIEELKEVLTVYSKSTEEAWLEILTQMEKLKDTVISYEMFKSLMNSICDN